MKESNSRQQIYCEWTWLVSFGGRIGRGGLGGSVENKILNKRWSGSVPASEFPDKSKRQSSTRMWVNYSFSFLLWSLLVSTDCDQTWDSVFSVPHANRASPDQTQGNRRMWWKKCWISGCKGWSELQYSMKVLSNWGQGPRLRSTGRDGAGYLLKDQWEQEEPGGRFQPRPLESSKGQTEERELRSQFQRARGRL